MVRILNWVVVAIIMFFPIAAFVVPRGVGGSFYLLLLCSLIGIVCRLRPAGVSFSQIFGEYKFTHLAMSGMLLATIANELCKEQFALNAFERAFYLACFPLFLWVLLLVPQRILKRVSWSLAIGAIACVATLCVETSIGKVRPIFVFAMPLIPFANLVLLSGVLAFLSAGWESGQNKWLFGLKAIAGIVALYGSYLSQARGNWLSLPLFITLALFIFNVRYKWRYLFWIGALLGGLCLVNQTVQERISIGYSDIEQFLGEGNRDTSLGQRFQNWEGAWVLYKENFAFGVGREQYSEAIKAVAEKGMISSVAATQPHSHNDILFQMATLGTFGLVAIVALYLGPAWYFFRDLRNPDQETRTLAGMGLALTLGFFVFGLSDVMFFWKISYVYYVIELAVLFALIHLRRQQLHHDVK